MLENFNYIVIIGGGLLALCLILILMEHIRLGRMIKKYRQLIKGLHDKNIEDLMVSYSDELSHVKSDIEGNIKSRISDLEGRMPTCLRNIALVSYNAFENIGNNMSFSLAALDDRKDGYVLTGIYTRENSYVYAKQVLAGQSKKELSREEKEALAKALSNIKLGSV